MHHFTWSDHLTIIYDLIYKLDGYQFCLLSTKSWCNYITDYDLKIQTSDD